MAKKPRGRRSAAATRARPVTLYCSFCGKSQHDVNKLIAGPTVFICNECTEICEDILWSDNADRIMIKVRLPSTSEFDEVLYDGISNLLRERFPDLDFKYECKSPTVSESTDKSKSSVIFSALKPYGSEYSDDGTPYNEIRKKYDDLRDEIAEVISQLSVANTKFIHESKRSETIQKELDELRIEYLEHLRETSKKLVRSQIELRVIMFLDVSGFSLLDRAGRERLLDMLRSMVPTLLTGTSASEINMWGDAVVATFSDPNHAIESAIRFVRHLEVDRMSVRVGMAWGEVRTNFNPATGRKDIDGDAVNRAARMEPMAPTGGILAAAEFGGLDIDPSLAELIPVEVEAKKSFGSIEQGEVIKAFRIRVLKN